MLINVLNKSLMTVYPLFYENTKALLKTVIKIIKSGKLWEKR